jgi:hypothetical protein
MEKSGKLSSFGSCRGIEVEPEVGRGGDGGNEWKIRNN